MSFIRLEERNIVINAQLGTCSSTGGRVCDDSTKSIKSGVCEICQKNRYGIHRREGLNGTMIKEGTGFKELD
jgi:hypothetical protein